MDEANTVVTSDTPVADTGASTPVADAPVGDIGALGGESAAIQANALPEGSAPAPAPIIPPDDSDLDGQIHQGVNGIRELRNAYRTLDRDYSAYKERFAPIEQKLQEWGGIETAETSVGLVSQLFSPITDPNTGQMLTDEYGVPQTTPAPFVQSLAQRSPMTLAAMLDAALPVELALPNGQSMTVGDLLVQEVLGLDPAKLDLYRQIQSPEDAANRGLLGDVTADELDGIPENYHAVYRSLPERERIRLQALDEGTRDMFLRNHAEAQEMRAFREQQLQQQQQQWQYQEQQRQAQIEQQAEQYTMSVRQEHAQAIAAELAKVQFSADPQANQQIQGLLMAATNQYVDSDPEVATRLARADALLRQQKRLELQGDALRANQVKVHALQEITSIATKAKIFAMNQVKVLQGIFGSTVNGSQPNARPVVGGNGQGNQGGSQIPQGSKPFDMSDDRARVMAQWVQNQTQRGW